MILKWSNYLAAYPCSQDHDTNVAALQKLIPQFEKPENAVRHLHNNKSLVCVTKSAFDSYIQATFNHAIMKSSCSFIQPLPDFLALAGFGTQATSVKINPKEMFKHPRNKSTFLHSSTCSNVKQLKIWVIWYSPRVKWSWIHMNYSLPFWRLNFSMKKIGNRRISW